MDCYIKEIIDKSKKENSKFHNRVKNNKRFWYIETYENSFVINSKEEGYIKQSQFDLDSEYYYITGNYINDFNYAIQLWYEITAFKSKVDKVINNFLNNSK